jgi:hypothetical protein
MIELAAEGESEGGVKTYGPRQLVPPTGPSTREKIDEKLD